MSEWSQSSLRPLRAITLAASVLLGSSCSSGIEGQPIVPPPVSAPAPHCNDESGENQHNYPVINIDALFTDALVNPADSVRFHNALDFHQGVAEALLQKSRVPQGTTVEVNVAVGSMRHSQEIGSAALLMVAIVGEGGEWGDSQNYNFTQNPLSFGKIASDRSDGILLRLTPAAPQTACIDPQRL